jgi:hypothetical protein
MSYKEWEYEHACDAHANAYLLPKLFEALADISPGGTRVLDVGCIIRILCGTAGTSSCGIGERSRSF